MRGQLPQHHLVLPEGLLRALALGDIDGLEQYEFSAFEVDERSRGEYVAQLSALAPQAQFARFDDAVPPQVGDETPAILLVGRETELDGAAPDQLLARIAVELLASRVRFDEHTIVEGRDRDR